MPDEEGKNTELDTEDETQHTSQDAYKEGREEDIEGSIPEGDQDPENATNTGGATSGGPPRKAGDPPDEDPSKLDHDPVEEN